MTLGKNCPILQIVGFQNSGKTTLTEKLIFRASIAGLKAASIKHHGHGGTPDTELSSKDSIRHHEAGAVVSSVEGEGVLQIRANFDNWDLEEMIKLYHFFSVDIIFVEGYKKKAYPKVFLIRDEDDLSLLNSLVNVRCVISHVKLDSKELEHYQVFQLEDDDLYIDFLMKEAMKKSRNRTMWGFL